MTENNRESTTPSSVLRKTRNLNDNPNAANFLPSAGQTMPNPKRVTISPKINVLG